MKMLLFPCMLASGLLLATALPIQAQTGIRSVTPTAPPTAPTAPSSSTGVTSGQINPAGLASPVSRPAGLTGRFPAGLPSPSPFPAGVPPVGGATATSPVAPAPALDTGGVAPAPVVMGAGGTGPGRTGAGGPNTPIELARSFLLADTNRDGELSRAEAQGLAIMPMGFEDMDTNRDGVISRFEYEDATR